MYIRGTLCHLVLARLMGEKPVLSLLRSKAKREAWKMKYRT